MAALEEIEAASWDEVVIEVEDSAISGLLENMESLDIREVNELAQQIKDRERRLELSKLKAVFAVTKPSNVSAAIQAAENLDDYIYATDLRTQEEVARDEIRVSTDEPRQSLLLKHTDLFTMGRELLNAPYLSMTEYGLIQHRDCSPLLSQEQPSQTQTM